MARASSYTSANAQPWKLYRDAELLAAIRERGRILPRHVQLAPTNRCNLKCPWCSCAERNVGAELSQESLDAMVTMLAGLGTKAVTITGGGEPTLHPDVGDMIGEFWERGIATGLVTNGVLTGGGRNRRTSFVLGSLTWCRVSFSDTRRWDEAFTDALDFLRRAPLLDLALSYVVTDKLNAENLQRCVDYATANRFTHIRVVSDILNPAASAMAEARALVGNVPGVIMQDRQEHTRGARRCLISLLKPVIAPDGYVYPCCGVQYAIDGDTMDFPARMRMGRWEELPKIVREQRYFDGSVCDRCYYSAYNEALASLLEHVDHEAFV